MSLPGIHWSLNATQANDDPSPDQPQMTRRRLAREDLDNKRIFERHDQVRRQFDRESGCADAVTPARAPQLLRVRWALDRVTEYLEKATLERNPKARETAEEHLTDAICEMGLDRSTPLATRLDAACATVLASKDTTLSTPLSTRETGPVHLKISTGGDVPDDQRDACQSWLDGMPIPVKRALAQVAIRVVPSSSAVLQPSGLMRTNYCWREGPRARFEEGTRELVISGSEPQWRALKAKTFKIAQSGYRSGVEVPRLFLAVAQAFEAVSTPRPSQEPMFWLDHSGDDIIDSLPVLEPHEDAAYRLARAMAGYRPEDPETRRFVETYLGAKSGR